MSKTKWHTKAIYIFVALAMVFSLAVLPMAGVAAAEDEVWVDPAYSESTPGWNITRFATIQSAVDNVTANGTVNVAAGTYYENVKIPAGLGNVKLLGHNKFDTTIAVSSKDAIKTKSPAKIQGFSLTTTGLTKGVRISASGTEECPGVIQDCRIGPFPNGRGIAFDGGTAWWEIRDCEIFDCRSGIYFENASNVLVSGNTFWGGLAECGGIEGANVAIVDNEFLGSDLDESEAIGFVAGAPTNLQILRNTITGYWYGIRLYPNPSPIDAEAHNNNIASNSVFGVLNESTAMFDAERNWWGDGSGPSHSPGLGDPVSDNVDFCPWLGAPYPGGNPVAPKLAVEITAPPTNSTVNICEMFAVTANVTNVGNATAGNVSVSLGWTGPAELVGGNLTYNVGDISPWSTQEINWTLHCTAEGDVRLRVTATEATCNSTHMSGEVVVHQPPECLPVDIDVKLDDGDGREICVCTNFTVTGNVTNTGQAPLSNVSVTLTVTSGDNAVITSSSKVWPGDLAVGQTRPVSWTLHCNNATFGDCPADNPVDVSAIAYGCSYDPNACVRCPTYVSASDSASSVVNQKWLIVDVTPMETCDNYCTGDEPNVWVNVTNCYDYAVTGTANITVSGNATLLAPPGPQQLLTVGPGQTKQVPLPWHVRCDNPGDATITVTYLGSTTDLKTLCDEDISIIHQYDPADLEVTASADPVCLAVCQNFTVTANITNTVAGSGNITNGTVTIYPYGGGMYPDWPQTKNLPNIPGGTTVSVNWTFHCHDSWTAWYWVEASGTDSVCGGTVSDGTGDKYVEQVDLEVEIITPTDSTTYSVCQTFCVTANITNIDNDTDMIVHDATISINGTAELVTGENATKLLSNGGDLDIGERQQVSWTLHCYDSGDAVITVTANVTSPCDLLFSDEITVHQETPAELEQEILSPDPDSFIATSQDFAVTAKVSNVGEADAIGVNVTLDTGPNASVVPPPGPTQTVDIPGNDFVVLTWTVHCEGSGITTLTVSAVGRDENSLDQVVCEVPATVTVWQYPAARLEVEITEYPTDPVVKCNTFNVTANITNTGEADAWEVSATLSVFPEGSARVTEGGYTQYIGNLVGHGLDGTKTVTWTLHCKEACESTITITVAGYDEYGWHQKQECQSTGTFVIEDVDGDGRAGGFWKVMWTPWKWVFCGWFEGKATGLTGPFIANGFVETHLDFEDSEFANQSFNGGYYDGELQASGFVTSDRMEFVGAVHLYGPRPTDGMTSDFGFTNNLSNNADDGTFWSVDGGLIRIINGNMVGAWWGWVDGVAFEEALTYGFYCSTMASTPGLAILERFIEPDSVTVKQIEPLLTVEVTAPDVVTEGDSYIVTAVVTNVAQDDAINVTATIQIAGDAEEAGDQSGLAEISGATIEAGDSAKAEWRVNCTGGEDVNISVEASGDDTNIAIGSVAVKQIPISPYLTVGVTAPAEVTEGDSYIVTAVVTNEGQEDADNVTATIQIAGDAEEAGDQSGLVKITNSTIAAGNQAKAEWRVNCTGGEDVNISVEASGDNTNVAIGSVAVKQIPISPYLTVGVTAPAEVTEGDSYIVTAVVTNEGQEDADNVTATIQIAGDAEEAGDQSGLAEISGATIEAGDQAKAEWRVNCTGGEDVNISVEASGDDTNVAIGSVAVKQIPISPYLTVEVSAPAEVTEGDDFVVTAVVTNIGQEDATAKTDGVTMTANGPASPSSDDANLPAIDAGDSVKVEFTLTCTGAGGVNVAVQAEGGNTNVAIDSAAVMQRPIEPYLVVDLSAPAEVNEDDTFVVTAVVTNIGQEDATAKTDGVTMTANGPASPSSDDANLPAIDAGDSVKVEFTLTCTGAGGVNVAVQAEGGNTNVAIDSAAVMQRPIEPYLVVDLSAPTHIYEGEPFTVTAVVSNIGDTDSTEDISVDMTASGLVWPLSDSDTIAGGLDAGDSAVVEFDLTCEGEGGVNVYVEASATDTNTAADSAAVQQMNVPEPEAFLELELTAPAQIPEDAMFTVCAVLSNTGDADAEDIDIWVEASDFTDPWGYVGYLAELPAGDSVVFGFDFLCTGEGGVNIAAEAEGANTNVAAASIAVQQLAVWEGPWLYVDVTAPDWAYVGDDYYVTAVVNNYGDMKATGVNATLDINGPASTLDPLTQAIGDIDAGSSAEVSWMLTADAQGGVNVIVTAEGTNTNTAVDAAAIQQGVIMWDELVVIPTSGVAPLEITASAKVSNSGNMATTTEAELYVDEVVVASQIVSLGAGAGRIVSFDYMLGAGTYNVTINGLEPIEVVVTPTPPIHLYEGPNPIEYTGSSADFPAVLTNIGPAGLGVAEIIWLRDVSTGGAWWYYLVPWDIPSPAEFTGMVTGKVYIVVVSAECDWYVLS